MPIFVYEGCGRARRPMITCRVTRITALTATAAYHPASSAALRSTLPASAPDTAYAEGVHRRLLPGQVGAVDPDPAALRQDTHGGIRARPALLR
jgi:hypothetical protein